MTGDELGGPIRWRMHLPEPPDGVFEALTTDAGRAAFWAESAVERNGTVCFRFIDGQVAECRILEQLRPSVYALEYFGAVARFELEPDGRGGTDLLLTHAGVPQEEWLDVYAGWLNVLFPLKAWLSASVDLRNHDPRRTWNEGFADQ